MKMEEFKIMKSVLSRELGWSWPLFLTGCWIRKRAIFRNTHWAKLKTTESEFAKRLSILKLFQTSGFTGAVPLKIQLLMERTSVFSFLKG